MLTVNNFIKSYIILKYRLSKEHLYSSELFIDNEKLEIDSESIYFSHNYLHSNSSIGYYIKNNNIQRIEYVKRFRLIVIYCKCLMHYSSDRGSYVQAVPEYKEIAVPIFDWFNPSLFNYLLDKDYLISYI